jgi:FtsP/CotA-like multicopper oxidase with cupredoxin domain
MHRLSRRDFLKASGTTALLSQVPHLAMAKSEDGYIDLVAKKSKQSLYYEDGPKSDLWSYNGVTPGPEFRVKQGEKIKVRFRNELDEPTSIHWHGIRIDNAMDGVSGLTQDAVKTGDTFIYEFTVPDAGTYWYHAHNKSWNQVARGLYGSLIVEELEPSFDKEHDITLILDDWRLHGEGVLETASLGTMMEWSHGGRLGNWITVNGQTLPQYKLNAGETYRLRLINAANARIFELDPNAFNAKILAYDGQPLQDPVALPYSPLLLGPAQRVDLLITPTMGNGFEIEEISGQEAFPLVGFDVIDNGTNQQYKLPTSNDIQEPDLGQAQYVKLDMIGGAMGNGGRMVYNGEEITERNFREARQFWAFNNVANLADKPLFSAQRNETILVEVHNDTAFLHAMHVHGHHFRVIDRSESTIDEGQPWRDTFMIGPGQVTKIAFVADNPGKWLLHCHMLEHAAAGMNTWFEVG